MVMHYKSLMGDFLKTLANGDELYTEHVVYSILIPMVAAIIIPQILVVWLQMKFTLKCIFVIV